MPFRGKFYIVKSTIHLIAPYIFKKEEDFCKMFNINHTL